MEGDSSDLIDSPKLTLPLIASKFRKKCSNRDFLESQEAPSVQSRELWRSVQSKLNVVKR